ncbi:MAG: tetratricopeptide repeat protein [Planctomycetota bacterium]
MIALLFGLLLGAGDTSVVGPGVVDLTRAERAYRAGKYSEAITTFLEALGEPGVSEGRLLYNLGNCAYRLRRHAEAVYYYRRAELRLRRDPEVEFNRRLAEEQLGVVERYGESFGAAVVGLVDSFTPGELLMLVGGLETASLVGLVLLRRRRAARNVMVLIVLIALAGAGRLLHDRWFGRPLSGIVLASEVELRSEPHSGMPVTLELEAGELVCVEEMSDRWVRVGHSRGGGWTERAGVGVVE